MLQPPIDDDQTADRTGHLVDSTTRACCRGIGRHVPDCPESSADLVERHGWHTTWCVGRDEPHDERWPYCERQIGGVDSAVTEPDWNRAQVWVSTIHAFLHGTFTTDYAAAADRNRKGVQLEFLVHDGIEWQTQRVNVHSGDARTLAALLVAAADVSDGITRIAAPEGQR